MRTRDDIEAYLTRAGLPFREIAEDGTMWLVRDTGWGEHVVVTLAGPLVLFRMKITTLAEVDRHPEFFKTLLEMNARDMIHGAYGISDGEVVLTGPAGAASFLPQPTRATAAMADMAARWIRDLFFMSVIMVLSGDGCS